MIIALLGLGTAPLGLGIVLLGLGERTPRIRSSGPGIEENAQLGLVLGMG